MEQAYAAVLRNGKFSFNQLWTFVSVFLSSRTSLAELYHYILMQGNDCPLPMVQRNSCARDLRSLCQADSNAQTRAMMYAFSPGSCSQDFDPGNLTQFDQVHVPIRLCKIRSPYFIHPRLRATLYCRTLQTFFSREVRMHTLVTDGLGALALLSTLLHSMRTTGNRLACVQRLPQTVPFLFAIGRMLSCRWIATRGRLQ